MIFDAITLVIEALGKLGLAFGSRLFCARIEAIVDAISFGVEMIVNPITSGVPPIVDSVASRVEPVIDPIASVIQPPVNTIAAPVIESIRGKNRYGTA